MANRLTSPGLEDRIKYLEQDMAKAEKKLEEIQRCLDNMMAWRHDLDQLTTTVEEILCHLSQHT